ncbi:dihydrodipicolinate synthase family protein [soil metagenome]
MITFPKLHGLIAAPYTAFHADGSLHLAFIEKQAEALIANGVMGAFVCGTTGEGVSLTGTERMQVAERWQQVAGDKLRIIVHVGHTCLAESRALAAHAQQINAAAVSNCAPFFFKPANLTDLVAFCAEVAAAAPSLPYYYYHIPSMTGVSLSAASFLRAASSVIPNLAGIKFTYENLMDYAECVRLEDGRFDAVFGRDEILVAGMSMGAKGAIGSTYNFAAPIYHRIIAAFDRGDLITAQAEQARANAMIDILIRYGGLTAGKAIMRLIGLDCGPVRLPLSDLSATQSEALRRDLEGVGFFDAI